MRELSTSQARRIALRAQGFGLAERPVTVDRGRLRRLMRRLRIIQLDSVPVIIRTQYLPAYSRLGPYDPALFDDVAYRKGEWLEGYIHEACLIPVEDEPWFRFLAARAMRGETWKGLHRLATNEPDYIAQVLRDVEERGPLRASELTSPRPRDGEWWGSRSVGSNALDWLARTGHVGIRRVGNFEKEFDLIDNMVPAEIRDLPTPDEDDAIRELLVRSTAALGLGTRACIVDYFRLPKKRAAALFGDVVEDGRIVECRVEGTDKPVYLDPDAVLPRRVDARAFVSPFDPIVWNRPRNEWLFDFEYRIEIYVPKEKRRYGYYVLPFLLGDRIVGRCDLKTDRDAGVLRLLSAFAEDHADLDEVAPEMAEELRLLAQLVGANGDVSVDASGVLADKIRTAL